MADSLRVRLVRALLCGVFFLAGVAGCGGSGEVAPYSDAEIEWLQSYGAWSGNLGRSSGVRRPYEELLAGRGDIGAYERAVQPWLQCSRSYRKRVGNPPGARLDRAAQLIERACRAFERSVRLQIRSFKGEVNLVFDAEAAGARANRLVLQAEEDLGRLLGDARPLPLRAGPGRTSRIDRRYTKAVEARLSGQAEARCWSEDDWPVLRDAVIALNGGDDVDILGFASNSGNRANLHPEACRALDRLVYEGDRPHSGSARRTLAHGLLVLAHETEHLVAPASSEADTECYALQRMRDAAASLGIPPGYAEELTQAAWQELYPDNDPEYRTPDCRDAGPLDARPRTRVFP